MVVLFTTYFGGEMREEPDIRSFQGVLLPIWCTLKLRNTTDNGVREILDCVNVTPRFTTSPSTGQIRNQAVFICIFSYIGWGFLHHCTFVKKGKYSISRRLCDFMPAICLYSIARALNCHIYELVD